jgi:hypothetical protein
MVVRPPPVGQPPESIVYTEPISLERDNSDQKFGRARITHDFRISAHQIRPRLFLGGASAAMDPHEIHEDRFTHVLNCLSANCAKFPAKGSLRGPSDRQIEAYQAAGLSPPDRLRYLTLDLLDIAEQDLLHVFPRTCLWIEARLNGDPDSDDEMHDPARAARVAQAAAEAEAKASEAAPNPSSSPDPSSAVLTLSESSASASSSSSTSDQGGPVSSAAPSPSDNPSSSISTSTSASTGASSSQSDPDSKPEADEAALAAANAAIIAERKSHKRPPHFKAFDPSAPPPPPPPPPHSALPSSPGRGGASAISASSSHTPRHTNNRVLVHCMAGVSRSASVLLAYMMWKEGITAARALREVQLRRSIVNPNEGFREQLLRWEEALQHDRLERGLPPLKRVDESLLEAHPELKAITNLFS